MKLIIANLKMNLTFDEILNYKKTINTKYDNLIMEIGKSFREQIKG